MDKLDGLNFAAPDFSTFLCSRLAYEEAESPDDPVSRTPFQRDRDRIIHSRAFRRLMHKTQIFNANYGDHYRNRLTHTLEVCQIARSIGKALRLNDTLIEAIALAHDLGHTPFGHVGERTLHGIMHGDIKIDGFERANEGFKHNYQALQVIDKIESERIDEIGMNLSLAVREGAFKHTGVKIKYNDRKDTVLYSSLDLTNIYIDKPSFTLEGQVVAIADEIAQCTHDLEDGVRAQVIRIDDILDNELIQNVIDESNIDTTRLHCALDVRMSIVKNLVGKLIRNVYNESSDNLINYNDRRKKEEKDLPEFKNLSDVYDEKLIGFSKDMGEKVEALSALITNCVVKSQLISQSDAKAEYMITQLFKAYYKHPKQLPDYILKRYCRKSGRSFSRSLLDDTLLQQDQTFIRMICDHIACMTDQYAEREYKKLYLPDYI